MVSTLSRLQCCRWFPLHGRLMEDEEMGCLHLHRVRGHQPDSDVGDGSMECVCSADSRHRHRHFIQSLVQNAMTTPPNQSTVAYCRPAGASDDSKILQRFLLSTSRFRRRR